jgi:exodeoxyribonuclease-3
VTRGLPGDPSDDQARYIEAVVSGPRPVRVASIYLPNGNPVASEKFPYKLAWMARLHRHAASLLQHEEPLALMGDYNVIPGPLDAANPGDWSDDALFQPESREAFRSLQWSGLTDAWAEVGDGPGGYTFWDYQAGAWPKNNGIRIDHALLSPQAADRLVACRIDRSPRGWEKPSDHTPLMIDLNFG